MIDRRAVLASGAAMGLAGVVRAAPSPSPQARVIDALALPVGFNGLLAHGRGGRVAHLRCSGFADVEARRPVTAATRFKWGSASKWLTSVAVLRLVEQGRLDLDAPIARYLPDFRAETGARLKLRHLLSNTSGIPDLLSRQLKTEPELRFSTATSAEIVARFGHGDLAFAPGEGWDYAALNWAIVGAIITRVTGEGVPATVGRLVLDPLKMRGAGFAQVDQPAMPQLAAAYTGTIPPTRKMTPVPGFVAASGNVAGTVDDAMRAAHGIFNGGLLRPAMRRELTTIRWAPQDYALGGRVQAIDGALWAWETGKVEGYRAHIAHRLDRSETIVIFNTTDMVQSDIASWVEAIARA